MSRVDCCNFSPLLGDESVPCQGTDGAPSQSPIMLRFGPLQGLDVQQFKWFKFLARTVSLADRSVHYSLYFSTVLKERDGSSPAGHAHTPW